MTRKGIDCRDFPGETGCTLYLSRREDHGTAAAAEHGISSHRAEDTSELPAWLRSKLQDEAEVKDEAALTPA